MYEYVQTRKASSVHEAFDKESHAQGISSNDGYSVLIRTQTRAAISLSSRRNVVASRKVLISTRKGEGQRRVAFQEDDRMQ